ncbi:hypothetical protein LVJ94_02340 [Pendulispora rubella]|uniref:Luciferase-like domain-containing protein n=1 Tax=Pendulispora rubella TaxID=2741070 RepID=A0ABZ2LBH4_9BACT
MPNSRNLLGADCIPISPFVLGMVGDANVVPAAFDAGINTFFLTADMHWPMYDALRRGLELLFERGRHVREQVCVMAVSYVTQREFAVLPFHEVIDCVRGLGHLDATIIGGAYKEDFLGRLPAYRNHTTGDVPGVRAIGSTFHDRAACAAALAEGLIDVAFTRYNTVHRNAEKDVFLAPRRPRTLLYNFKSVMDHVSKARFAELRLGADYWYPEVWDHYRFALTTGPFDGLLCSFRNEYQLRESLDGIARGPLSEEEVQYMIDLADLHLGHATLASE